MNSNLMDLSLGEIIDRTNKRNGKRVGLGNQKQTGAGRRNGVKSGGITKPAIKRPGGVQSILKKAAPVVDARLKLIAKTRSKIGDARDHLNQLMRKGDARNRISPRVRNEIPAKRGDPLPRRTLTTNRNQAHRLPPLMAQSTTGRYRNTPNTVSRTIKNGSNRPIARGGTAYMDRERSDEPVDWNSRMQSLPRLEIHVPTMREREHILHRTHMDLESNHWGRSSKPQIVYRPRDDVKSRLEPLRQQDGYRIVVSNLQPTVTHEDIKELFEDVGVLIGSRVVRPGTAEVVYKNHEDAISAVDTYHNRQLDGQPMKCLLVKSSQSSKTGKDVMLDISTVHRALFTK